MKGRYKKDGDGIRKLLRAARSRGWRIEERKSGTMVFPSDGSQAFLVHGTYGSSKALKNVEKLFARAGLDVRGGLQKGRKEDSRG